MYENYLVVYALGAFIIDGKKRLLLIKKSPKEQIDPGKWVVPGGKVHKDENIIDALKREVKEEVGLTIKSFRWIGEDVFQEDNKYFHAPHFLCRVKAYKRIILEKKMEKFVWVSKKEVLEMSKEIPTGIMNEIINIFKNYIS